MNLYNKDRLALSDFSYWEVELKNNVKKTLLEIKYRYP